MERVPGIVMAGVLVGLAVSAGCSSEPICGEEPTCLPGASRVEECPSGQECREVSACGQTITCVGGSGVPGSDGGRGDTGADVEDVSDGKDAADGSDTGEGTADVRDGGTEAGDGASSLDGPVHYGGDRPSRSGAGWERPESMIWPEIGGGAGYGRTRCEPPTGAASATTKDELLSALGLAEDGEVVWVPGSASVNLTGESGIAVPEGVTLASDRGCDDSDGATLYRDRGERSAPVLSVRANARVTGFEFRGYGYSERGPDFTPAPREATLSVGLSVDGNGAEIGNNHVTSFVGKCIRVGRDVTDAWIHHNRIEWCHRLGYGYGISIGTGGRMLVEFNRIDNTRHAVAGEGGSQSMYEARYNVVGPYRQNHVFDMHGADGVGGKTLLVHHNTILGKWTYNNDGVCVQAQPYVSVRAEPIEPLQIHRNWMVDQDEQWIISVEGGAYEASNNHLGSDPSCDVGAPRRGCTRYAAPKLAPANPAYDGYRSFGSYNVVPADDGDPCLEPSVE